MDIGVIAKRYARALLQYAVGEKAEDTVYDEVLQFIHDYRTVPQLREVLHNPLLSPAEKERVLCQAASTAASPVFRKFAALVVAHHREAFMLFIAHSYADLYLRHKGIRTARLTTAVPVSDAVSRRLTDWAATTAGPGVTLRLETDVDPALLGGFIFQVGDRRLDASVASQFEQIKKQFIEKNKRIV